MSNLLLFKAGKRPAFYFKGKVYEYKEDNSVVSEDIKFLSDMNGASQVNVISVIETIGVSKEFSVYIHKGEESIEKLVAGFGTRFVTNLTLDRDYDQVIVRNGVLDSRRYKQTIFIYSPRINIIEKIDYLKR